ncbi:MAG: hypothetical protein HKP41_16375 [Desulfobacterales bacterium]|nr:hypothetical protein [Desulfobacterales bacterium]
MVERTKVKQKEQVNATVTESSATEVSKVGIITVAAFGGLVGLWSLASIIAGMAASGGPLAFIGDWFRAVSGM